MSGGAFITAFRLVSRHDPLTIPTGSIQIARRFPLNMHIAP